MGNTNTKKILTLSGRIAKQWGLGEPIGKVWGFLLFESIPITQKEIEEGIDYSRGLISRSLKKLKELDLILIDKKGNEFYYSTNSSLIKGFNKIIKSFMEAEVYPLIKTMSENLNEIEDETVKKNIRRMIKEYKQLKLGMSIFSKTMESLPLLEINNLVELTKKYSKNKNERR